MGEGAAGELTTGFLGVRNVSEGGFPFVTAYLRRRRSIAADLDFGRRARAAEMLGSAPQERRKPLS